MPLRETLHAVAEAREITGSRGLTDYLKKALTSASLYRLYRRFLTLFRRFRLFSAILRTTVTLLSLIETGAFVLLFTVLFFLVLPILLALSLGALLAALLGAKRQNRLLASKLDGKRVYVLFLPRRLPENSFFARNVADLAGREGVSVLVVSPFLLSAKGSAGEKYAGKKRTGKGRSGKKRFYVTARQEPDGSILLRKTYFFSLRKHLLSHTKTAYLF